MLKFDSVGVYRRSGAQFTGLYLALAFATYWIVQSGTNTFVNREWALRILVTLICVVPIFLPERPDVQTSEVIYPYYWIVAGFICGLAFFMIAQLYSYSVENSISIAYSMLVISTSLLSHIFPPSVEEKDIVETVE